jgi:flagellar protein FliO/FliZ
LVTLVDWGRALFALIATLALIGLVAYGARRLGMIQPGQAGVRRLKVLESLMLDPRRRLVVVRFDNREHLLLLSPAGDRSIADVAANAVSESGEARP